MNAYHIYGKQRLASSRLMAAVQVLRFFAYFREDLP